MENLITVLGILVIVVLVIVAGPIFTIMSLNTLFGMSIALTWKTWLSAAWLAGLVVASASNRKSN